jgi:hypothetical protein
MTMNIASGYLNQKYYSNLNIESPTRVNLRGQRKPLQQISSSILSTPLIIRLKAPVDWEMYNSEAVYLWDI